MGPSPSGSSGDGAFAALVRVVAPTFGPSSSLGVMCCWAWVNVATWFIVRGAVALSLREIVNPFGLRAWQLLLVLAVKPYGVEAGTDAMVKLWVRAVKAPLMPSRDPPIGDGLATFQIRDWLAVSVNQITEVIFMQHFALFVWTSPMLDRSLDGFGVVQTVVALVGILLLIVVGDFFYYWTHRWMHLRHVFPLVHKQHHRQHLPARGYTDGINVTPMEEVYGIFAGNVAAISIVGMSLGLHVCTVVAYLVLYGLFNVSNHTPYDLTVPLLGYSVRAHEMHHRKYVGNYANIIPLWDHLFGTYIPYDSGQIKWD